MYSEKHYLWQWNLLKSEIKLKKDYHASQRDQYVEVSLKKGFLRNCKIKVMIAHIQVNIELYITAKSMYGARYVKQIINI